MLLFTSDLDRTLIYSQRMMDKYPPNTAPITAERKDGEALSMMTEVTMSLLQQVHQQTLFVPVTTRAIHQYERIHVIKELRPTFAITSNGGTIIEQGRPNMEWSRILRKRIEDSSIPQADLVRQFNSIKSDDWLQQSFYVDELFYVHYVDCNILQQDEVQAIIQDFAVHGWHVLLQGRKLYFMPKALTKEAAISYLKEHCTYNMHLAAGDSIMDYGMLALADRGYTPYHGDLKDKQPQILKNTVYSAHSGEAFTKYLLEDVLQLAAKQPIVEV
ncbi:HAD family hydrolase [Lysinibacillus sp. NPDC097162]|uniref:HAD family hydrolase n=1 Tax=Lysinibacillus sp. NPDC097162 TaxID=3364140 RepID=UPI003821B6BE